MTSTTSKECPRYLVVHPGAELFGSDRMLVESVKGMTADGAAVTVAVPELGPLIDEVQRAGASVVIVPMLVLRKSLLKPRNWLRLVRESLRGLGSAWRLLSRVRPDVVYVSTITIPQWPLVAAARRMPVVSHVHEAEASGSLLVNIALYAPHIVAQGVLVNSEFSRETIARSLSPLAARAQVLYNGVEGPPAISAPRTHIDELRVLYVGRLSPRKGVDLVLDSLAQSLAAGMNMHVTLLGSVFAGYEWYEEDLRRRAEAVGVENVTFLGFRPDIWPILAQHDILVVPSRVDEPFGNTAVEGILAHRPVIASDTSGLREAAGGYPTATLVPPGEAQPLTTALAGVAGDWENLSARVAESARAANARHAPVHYRAKIAETMSQVAAAR